MAKFKVGDKVKVTGTTFNSKEPYVGNIYTIIKIDPAFHDGRGPRYHIDDESVGWIFYDSELELIKPKFNIKDYPGKYAMHVTTEEQAEIFCKYMHILDKRWIKGNSYDEITHFNIFLDLTVYYFNNNTYGNIGFAILNTYKILEFDDFDWSDFTTMKEFTKKDLKNGDVIQKRDGSVEIVCLESNTLICSKGWNPLCEIKSDLTDTYHTEHDIVAVRRPEYPSDCQFDAFVEHRGLLVYERKEIEEMTLEEVCKALGKEIKIVKE